MKKIISILLVIVLAISLGACSRKVEEEIPQIVDDNGQQGNQQQQPTEPEQQEVEVTLYYINREYVETGDESLEQNIAVTRQISLGGQSLIEAILGELQKQPKEENIETLMDEISVISAEVKEGIAYVNLASEGLAGGSLEEISIIRQIVYTLTELEDVNSVQLLVNGEKQETLMGHYLIENPLTKKDI